MRTILYTGKGGVGKTSVAAATARRAAAAGLRVLVLSTDPAHSLADALQTPLGASPRPVAERLDAQQVSAQRELEQHWSSVQGWLGRVLHERGADRITADELSVPPGADELFALLQLRRHHEEDAYDLLVVDCAPTGETLRLLSFPDVARWWLEHGMPLLAAVRPLARTLLDLPVPEPAVLEDVERLGRNLIAMNELLRDRSQVSVRLVMTPDRMVVDEARRTATYLNLYGFLTDAVVVNRVLPEEAGPYFGAWRATQQEVLADVQAAFAPVPLLQAPWFGEEVVGPAALDRLGAALFATSAPEAVLHDRLTHELRVDDAGAELRIDLPFTARGEVALRRIGDDLVLRVGDVKRVLALPPALGDYAARSAALDEGVLRVIFDAPDRAS